MHNLIILMHKLMHHPNKIPGAIKELFTQHSHIHSYNTRNKFDLHATHINTKTYGCRKLSFLFRQNWNSLPSTTKNRNLLESSKHPFRIFFLKNICEFNYRFYYGSHVGGQKNAHQLIFPYNIIENSPTSLAHNSAFIVPNISFKLGTETPCLVLWAISKFGPN